MLFSIMVATIYIPTNRVDGFPFLISSLAFTVCRLYDDGRSNLCEMIPHYSFDLYFSHN